MPNTIRSSEPDWPIFQGKRKAILVGQIIAFTERQPFSYVGSRANPHLLQIPHPRRDINIVLEQIDHLLPALGHDDDGAAGKLQARDVIVGGGFLENRTYAHGQSGFSFISCIRPGGKERRGGLYSNQTGEKNKLTSHFEQPAGLGRLQPGEMLSIHLPPD